MQTSVKRTGMTDVIYFEGAPSLRKGASEWFYPPDLHLLLTPLVGRLRVGVTGTVEYHAYQGRALSECVI